MDDLDHLYRDAFGWDQAMLDVVHLALGCYLCPRWPGSLSPAWAAIIGAPSSGKSTIVKMFDGLPWTVAVDHLTNNAVTSCYTSEDNPDEDFSLLARLSCKRKPEGPKVWVIQELSSLLAADPVILEKQLADLRAAHVGTHTSHGGMSGTVTREIGPFGLITGTTEAFEAIRRRMTTFGDRFLSIRMSTRSATRDEIVGESSSAWTADPAALNALKQKIKDATHLVIERGIKGLATTKLTDVPRNEVQTKQLAAWSTIHTVFATSPVAPGILATTPGKPYRIVEQVKAWGNTHAVIAGRDKWGEDEMRISRRLFHDSMPRASFDALKLLWTGKPPVASDLIRQWCALGAVETHTGKPQLTEQYRALIGGSNYFEKGKRS